jgi:hypothetical protein
MIMNREDTSERSKVSALRPPLAYTAAEAAAIIGGSCKASWLKAQARSRKIPYVKIGGAYNFTDAHIAEIISILEVRPKEQPAGKPPADSRRPPGIAAELRVQGAPLLKTRAPRTLRRRPAGDDGAGNT